MNPCFMCKQRRAVVVRRTSPIDSARAFQRVEMCEACDAQSTGRDVARKLGVAAPWPKEE